MKKGSTGAVKQTKNFIGQKLTIGLDLGDRSSLYCVLNEAGEIVLEQRLGTTPKAMQEGFGGMPRSRIALETGMHSPWVSRELGQLEHEVIVAHARNVRLIGESRRKDDRLDAQTLARLARIDPQLLCPVKHRSARAQADLTVIRGRTGLVRARTALVNTARGLAKSYGERLRGCNVRNMNPEKAEGLSLELQTALQPLLAAIESLSERIREYNGQLTSRPFSQRFRAPARPRTRPARKNAAAVTAKRRRRSEPTNCERMEMPTTAKMAMRPASRSSRTRLGDSRIVPHCHQVAATWSPRRRTRRNGGAASLPRTFSGVTRPTSVMIPITMSLPYLSDFGGANQPKGSEEKEPNMLIIGCDYHPGSQQIAFVDTETREVGGASAAVPGVAVR